MFIYVQKKIFVPNIYQCFIEINVIIYLILQTFFLVIFFCLTIDDYIVVSCIKIYLYRVFSFLSMDHIMGYIEYNVRILAIFCLYVCMFFFLRGKCKNHGLIHQVLFLVEYNIRLHCYHIHKILFE